MVFGLGSNKKAKAVNDDATNTGADDANDVLQSMDGKDAGNCPFC